MCESSQSIRQWMEQPIVFRREGWKFAIITSVALAAFAFGAYCYTYGIASPLYNHTYAYTLWGVATVLVLSSLTSYVARAIVSRNRFREESFREERRKLKDQWEFNYNFFIPKEYRTNLPMYEGLRGSTGYFDQHCRLDFSNGPIIRGLCDEIPFVAVRLRFSTNRENPVTFMIGPNPSGYWFTSCSDSRIPHQANLMESESPESPENLLFRNWLKGIIEGEERGHLIMDRQRGCLYELGRQDVVTLWRD